MGFACGRAGGVPVGLVMGGGMGVLSWRGEFEDVHGLRGGGDAQQGRGRVEGHAVDPGGHAAAAELVEFLAVWDGEDADHGAFFR